jgi:anti-sigma-K factor RskA
MTNLEYEEIKQYLLGLAPPEVQRAIEERLLTEESFLEELGFAEEELIDDYVAGDLSTSERARFEQHFLSTDERHRKLRFSRALTRYSSEKIGTTSDEPSRTGRTPAERLRAFWRGRPAWLRAAATVAVVAVLAGAWWFSFPRTSSPKTFAMLSLSVAASNRGEGTQASKVTLPLKEDALKIALRLPEGSSPASRYRVELLDEKDEKKSLEIAEHDDKSVTVMIPADQLARGQYALRLYATRDGGEEQRVPGSYFFTAK